VTQLSPVPFASGNIEEDEDLDFDNLVLTQAMPLHRPPRCASFFPSQFPKVVCAVQGHQTRHGDASIRRHERRRRRTRRRTSTGTSWSLLLYNNLLRRTWQPAWIDAQEGTLLAHDTSAMLMLMISAGPTPQKHSTPNLRGLRIDWLWTRHPR